MSVGSYFYDGEGKRVKKVVGGETTIFVYSSGKLVAEYSTTPPPETGSINYTTTDHLGSPRVITNAIGQVQSRRDFMPFGEEMQPAVGNRSANTEYTAGDQVRQKFTGYQKDEETKLDFAEARMYENRHGRFTAVDPLLASGTSIDPQTFNRYAYVVNNPLVLVDPDGEKPVYMYRTKANGGRHWIQLDSTWKNYKEHLATYQKRGYEVENGYGRIIESKGKFYQLTSEGFRPAIPTQSGEKEEMPSGTSPTIMFEVAGGAIDSVVPFGQQIRDKLGLDFADTNSQVYNNVNSAGTIVQLPFLIKSLPRLASTLFRGSDDVARNYSAAFQFTLDASDLGKNSGVHFNRANAALSNALEASPEFAKQMESLIPGVTNSVSRVGGRANPSGWTWHHAVSDANTPLGTLQLVPTVQHRSKYFQSVLHPNGFGGYFELRNFRSGSQ